MAEATQDEQPTRPSARTLFQVARGFSCVFWGIPVSLLLFFGAVDVDLMLRIRLPGYIIGVVFIYFGFILLQRAPPLTGVWTFWARLGLGLSFTMVYFAPFFHWWKQKPFTPFFVLNMLALLIVCAWLLYVINRLGAELGRGLGNADLAMESGVCSWASILLMTPPVLITVSFCAYAADLYDAAWITEWSSGQTRLPIWVYLFFLVPIALTMTTAWKAGTACMETVAHAAEEPRST